MKKLSSVFGDEDYDDNRLTAEGLDGPISDEFGPEKAPRPQLSRVELTELGGVASTLIAFAHQPQSARVETTEPFIEQNAFTSYENVIIQYFFDHLGEQLKISDFAEVSLRESVAEAHSDMKHLMSKLQKAGFKNAITVTGRTRGTRYSVDAEQAAELIPLLNLATLPNPISEKVGKEGGATSTPERHLKERDTKVQNLLMRYRHHRLVKVALQTAQKKPAKLSPNQSEVSLYIASHGEYKLLDRGDEQLLFFDLDRAVRLADTIDDFDALSPTQELVLIHGVIAHELLHRSNIRLVVKVSKPYWNQGLDVEDVLQEANRGLVAAISRFDMSKRTKLSTYAVPWIKQFCSRALDNQSRTMRVPVHKLNEIRSTYHAVTAAVKDIDRELTDDEMMEHIGMSIADYDTLQSVAKPSVVELDAPFGPDGNDRHDALGHTSEPVDESAIRNESRAHLAELIARADISDMQRMVLGLRSAIEPDMLPGLGVTLRGGKTLSYDEVMAETLTSSGRDLFEVADLLNMDRFAVRRLESTAIATIKKDRPQAHRPETTAIAAIKSILNS